jgi:hypothetical protein
MDAAKIDEVYFERVFNLGNYETFCLGLRATVGPKQSPESVVKQLDEFTLKMRNERTARRQRFERYNSSRKTRENRRFHGA